MWRRRTMCREEIQSHTTQWHANVELEFGNGHVSLRIPFHLQYVHFKCLNPKFFNSILVVEIVMLFFVLIQTYLWAGGQWMVMEVVEVEWCGLEVHHKLTHMNFPMNMVGLCLDSKSRSTLSKHSTPWKKVLVSRYANPKNFQFLDLELVLYY